MRKYLLLLMMFVCCNMVAQELVHFTIQPTGRFLNEDGKDFVVVEFEGKSADELYSMVKTNVMTMYNNPKEVMSESDGVITIFAYEKNIWVVKSLGATGLYDGSYKLIFRFKDGRVRVDAPSISDVFILSGGAFTNTIGIDKKVYLSSCAKKVCKSKSKKDQEKKSLLENVVNIPINYLLGLSKSQSTKVDDDW